MYDLRLAVIEILLGEMLLLKMLKISHPSVVISEDESVLLLFLLNCEKKSFIFRFLACVFVFSGYTTTVVKYTA